MVKNADVFSCTTQVFLNCLRRGYLKLYEVMRKNCRFNKIFSFV